MGAGWDVMGGMRKDGWGEIHTSKPPRSPSLHAGTAAVGGDGGAAGELGGAGGAGGGVH